MMKGEKTMKLSVRYGWFIVSLCVGLLVGGCATYYKVTDPESGKEYYTQKIDDVRGGAVKMMDARTGSIITLQNSEVKEISEKEYKAGLAQSVCRTGRGTCPALQHRVQACANTAAELSSAPWYEMTLFPTPR
jgi:hypothetical protein